MTRRRHATIRTDAELSRAIADLIESCSIMAAIYGHVGMPALRDYSADFAGLSRIIVGQQLSTASANAIWTRVSNALSVIDADAISTARDDDLISHGLSRGKIRALRALSGAVLSDALDFARLNRASDEGIVERLTEIHGIGPWTAQIYLLFALRRADAFPAGDLALQIAVQRRLKLTERPSSAALTDIAERWRPWRGAAARLLWSDYGATATKAAAGRRARPSPKAAKPKE